MNFKSKLALFCGGLSAVMLLAVAMAAVPSIGPWPITGSLPTAPQGFSSFTTSPALITATSATSNLSISSTGCTLTGVGTVLTKAASGTYVYDKIVNGQPAYDVTGGSTNEVWQNTSGVWVVSATADVGGNPTSYLTGGTGALLGQNFNVANGTSVTGGSCSAVATNFQSTGASLPCSLLVISCSTQSCYVLSSSGGAATLSIPANSSMQVPVSNVNQVWVQTTGTANASVGYGYYHN